MSNLSVKDIANSNIARTDKLYAFNNNESKAATIENIVQSVPGLMATGTCDTAGATAAKAVTSADWNHKPGLSILVEFANENSANNVTLSINGGTAIPVYYLNTATEQISGNVIPAGAVIFTLNAAGNKFYAHVTKLIEGAGVKIDGNKIEAVNDLPTDAVLHYSFDEVPDYPDGQATYKKNNDWTNLDYWTIDTNNTVNSYSSGIIKLTTTNNEYIQIARSSKPDDTFAGKILYIKLKVSQVGKEIRFRGAKSGSYPVIAEVRSTDTWQTLIGYIPSDYGNRVIFQFLVDEIGATVEISQIYIGDGSYSTPVIDNANGKWNSVSQSGVAVQGVSGRGIKCYGDNNVNCGSVKLNNDFTLSLWIKPDNADTSLKGAILYIQNQILLRNGDYASSITKLNMIIYTENSTQLNQNISDLLEANKWSHLVIIKSGTTSKSYINGSVVGTYTLPNATLRQPGANMLFGMSWGSNTRPQSYDDLLIFDRALTEKEVVALYNNKANTPKYYSKADYKLEQIANNS